MSAKDDYREMIDGEVVKVDLTKAPERRKKESFLPRLAYIIISFLAGAVFIFARNNIFAVLGYVVGAIVLIMGVVTITAFIVEKGNKWVGSLIWGILQILLGIFCLCKPKWIADVSVYICAVIFFISGIVMVYFAIKDKGIGFRNWIPELVAGIVLALLGVVMLLFVRKTEAVVAVITGVGFIVTAVINVVALILK